MSIFAICSDADRFLEKVTPSIFRLSTLAIAESKGGTTIRRMRLGSTKMSRHTWTLGRNRSNSNASEVKVLTINALRRLRVTERIKRSLACPSGDHEPTVVLSSLLTPIVAEDSSVTPQCPRVAARLQRSAHSAINVIIYNPLTIIAL